MSATKYTRGQKLWVKIYSNWYKAVYIGSNMVKVTDWTSSYTHIAIEDCAVREREDDLSLSEIWNLIFKP